MLVLGESCPSLFSASTSTLSYSVMTSVIVQVADSVTESSSGKFIMETPQTSGTGPLPTGQWQTDLRQATLCPWPCSPLLSTPLLTTLRSLLLESSFVSGRLSPQRSLCFQMRPIGRLCTASLISSSFNTVPRCKTLTLAHFDPLTSFTGRHSSGETGESIFLCGSWRQHERIKR